MLLKNPRKDSAFKRKLASFIDLDRIRFHEMQAFVSGNHKFTLLGFCFALLGRGKIASALRRAKRDCHFAGGSDETSLFLLRSVLEIASSAPRMGEFLWERLQWRGKYQFYSALNLALAVAPSRELEDSCIVREVELNCISKIQSCHIGKYGNSRLADYLLDGPDKRREFATILFAKSHDSGVRIYDSAYPAILLALKRTQSAEIRNRLLAIKRGIEKTNPQATLSTVAREILASSRSPITELYALSRRRRLSRSDSCIVALMVAQNLSDQGNSHRALEMLGQAAIFAQGNPKLAAWVGNQLGDAHNASRALFDYASDLCSKNPQNGFPFHPERFRAVEAALRFLFQGDQQLFLDDIRMQISRFERLGDNWTVERLNQWLAAGTGFDAYLARRLESARDIRYDPNEERISQRAIAERLFLEGASHSFERYLGTGLRRFERSASGNDAPWIHGSRALFEGLTASVDAFRSGKTTTESRNAARRARRLLRRASVFSGAQDPLALSLAFEAFYAGWNRIEPSSIQRMTIAANMLVPRTPEVREIRKRILDARWKMIGWIVKRGRLGLAKARRLWLTIASLGPLLDEVIDEDSRLRDSFSPIGRIWDPERLLPRIEDIVSVSNPHRRGKLLEDAMVKVFRRSTGFRVIDVRHNSKFEEIDIIIQATENIPMVTQWGPIIIVECKNWREKVGTDPVRSFYTKMLTKKGAVKLGIFVAPGGFTKGVEELIKQFQEALILLIDARDLDELLRGRKSLRTLVEEKIPLAIFA